MERQHLPMPLSVAFLSTPILEVPHAHPELGSTPLIEFLYFLISFLYLEERREMRTTTDQNLNISLAMINFWLYPSRRGLG